MSRRMILSTAAVGALVLACAGYAWAAFKVQADKDNVVASRLEGKWVLNKDLTGRLTGRKDVGVSYEFTKDDKVVADIPAKYEEPLKGMTIYMSGKMSITRDGKTQSYPFILVNYKGNPHVMHFTPGGDGESNMVMLASAKEKADDVLFVGADFNNDPFCAFDRQKEK